MSLFGKKSSEDPSPQSHHAIGSELIISGSEEPIQIQQALNAASVSGATLESIPSVIGPDTKYVVIINPPLNSLTGVASKVKAEREQRNDGFPVLILLPALDNLTQLGAWLEEQAKASNLSGLRVGIPTSNVASEVANFKGPIFGPDVVLMPTAPEIQNSPTKSFFSLSPESRRTTAFIGELAQNGISRVYLLGAPGAGKTSLAYFYFLKRQKGNFVTVNLNSESTGDKASMKSLICGHVAGSSPGAQTREGALSFAREGVCFLDESHGATGSVMQVLMEVLENGQFLPYGATAKRPLECAVLFASNRSWETLRGLMHIDEHARLGATIVEITDLRFRPEDIIAVLSTTLARMKNKFQTWRAPTGLSLEAWKLIRECPWRGNVRSLMRVIESATVEFGQKEQSTAVLTEEHLKPALELWEPEQTVDPIQYASFVGKGASN